MPGHRSRRTIRTTPYWASCPEGEPFTGNAEERAVSWVWLSAHALLRALQLRFIELKSVFEKSSDHWGFEDPMDEPGEAGWVLGNPMTRT